jgi:hypothetical protein
LKAVHYLFARFFSFLALSLFAATPVVPIPLPSSCCLGALLPLLVAASSSLSGLSSGV